MVTRAQLADVLIAELDRRLAVMEERLDVVEGPTWQQRRWIEWATEALDEPDEPDMHSAGVFVRFLAEQRGPKDPDVVRLRERLARAENEPNK